MKMLMLSLSFSVKSSAVQTLRAFAVSSSSTVTWWNAVPGATVYRLAWGPTAGTYISSFFCLLVLHLTTFQFHFVVCFSFNFLSL